MSGQVGLGRKTRGMTGCAAGGRISACWQSGQRCLLAMDLRKPGVAHVDDIVHAGLPRRPPPGRSKGGGGKTPRAQDVIRMVGVDLQIVGPAGERAADVLPGSARFRGSRSCTISIGSLPMLAQELACLSWSRQCKPGDWRKHRDRADRAERTPGPVSRPWLRIGTSRAPTSPRNGSRDSRRRRPCRRRRGRSAVHSRSLALRVVGIGLDSGTVSGRDRRSTPSPPHDPQHCATVFSRCAARGRRRAWPSWPGRYGR